MKWLDLRDPDFALMLLCAGFTAGAVVASRKYHTLDKGWHRLGWNVRCKCGRKMKAGVQMFVPAEVIVDHSAVVEEHVTHPLAAAIDKTVKRAQLQARTGRFS